MTGPAFAILAMFYLGANDKLHLDNLMQIRANSYCNNGPTWSSRLLRPFLQLIDISAAFCIADSDAAADADA